MQTQPALPVAQPVSQYGQPMQQFPPQGPPAYYGAPPPVQQMGPTEPVKAQVVGGRPGDVLDPTGKYNVKFQGSFAAVDVVISKEDGPTSVKTDGGAMLTMSNEVGLSAQLEGTPMQALFRCCCADATAFFNHFFIEPQYPPGTRGDVLLAPSFPGEIILIHMGGAPGETWCIQKGSFLACDAGVNIGVHTQGLSQGFKSGEGFFILKAEGQGRLVLASYGSIVKYDLQPGEVRKVDAGYMVAWQGHMPYTIGRASSSLKSSLLSGEGNVSSYTGPGTLYVQTRSVEKFARALNPFINRGGGSGGGLELPSLNFP